MPEEKITPEEKLLKIIEGKPIAKSKLPDFGAKIKGFKIGELASKLKNLLHFDKSKLKNLNFSVLNKALIGVCAVLTILFFFDFFRTSLNLSARLKTIAQSEPVKGAGEKKKLAVNADIKEITGLTKKRNMFSFIPPKPAPTAEKSPEFSQLVADLKLVGILWSDNPQAMIENSKEKKTYLLGAGEKIGEITVKKIFNEKVILGKGEQEWELR